MGPATRSGCEAQCLNANMPCRGCYGPPGNTVDQGAKMLSMLAALINSEDEKTIRAVSDQFVDPAGTSYRYTLATSGMGSLKEKDFEASNLINLQTESGRDEDSFN